MACKALTPRAPRAGAPDERDDVTTTVALPLPRSDVVKGSGDTLGFSDARAGTLCGRLGCFDPSPEFTKDTLGTGVTGFSAGAVTGPLNIPEASSCLTC